LDEVNCLNKDSQHHLRAFMDKYQNRHGFIFTTNHLHGVEASIQSRCEVIELPAIQPKKLLPLCQRFLKAEGIELADQYILDAIGNTFGDMRKVFGVLKYIVTQNNQKIIAMQAKPKKAAA
jgi:DNA polymerase III delta prime subunit